MIYLSLDYRDLYIVTIIYGYENDQINNNK